MQEHVKKFNNLFEQYRNLIKKNENLRKEKVELLRALHIKEKAKSFAVEKEQFLKKRIIQFYGIKAIGELMNTIEAPGGFDSQRFKEKSEKFAIENASS